MPDNERSEEYRYLSDMSIVPEIPDYIQERYDEVERIFLQYLRNSNASEEDIAEEKTLIHNAFIFAYKAHRNQKRKTGEMYIIHPLAVARILADLEVDAETIAGALLHDTIEDTEADEELLTQIFGHAVANMVNGVTKINSSLELVNYDSKEEIQATNVRKMVMAMTDDIRVIFIKLADRLHNMRTMKHQTPEKQVEKARETLDIYVPFAGRFGIYKIKWELEDLCLRYIDPDAYYELVGLVNGKRSEREAFMENVVTQLNEKLKEYNIKNFEIEGRPKHFYSIYKKMKTKGKTIDEIYDMFACRIIVEEVTDCYTVLGIVHEMYSHIPGRFKDYIAMPKENKYQSIHTTVIGPSGIPFEVQIRTFAMHKIAEYGIAAHWHYKESGDSHEFQADKYDEKISEVRQLLDSQTELSDPTAFIEYLKTNIAPEEVFVYTPKGEVVRLPIGSCPIDFAYHIHSGVGNHMHGAKVNGRIVPLSYQLKNADQVEILTSQKIKGPSMDWLNIVRTTSAKNKINAYFKKEARAENVAIGKEKLEREIERNGFKPEDLLVDKAIDPILRRNTFANLDDLYASIGYGTTSVIKVFGRLRDDYLRSISPEERQKLGYRIAIDGQVVYRPDEMPIELGKFDQNSRPVKKSKDPDKQREIIDEKVKIPRAKRPGDSVVIVDGLENVATHYAKCCHPVYGDEIIGYITQSKGVGIHKTNCQNMVNIIKYKDRSQKDLERYRRIVNCRWLVNARDSIFDIAIVITANDRPDLLFDILDHIREEKASIVKVNTLVGDDFICHINITLTIANKAQFDRIVGRIKGVRDVIDVSRK
ncbi:MAG: bifunctional (p)ppGpp synthetase/guanosine-3',5'-bis(diphosphate) 3'-pyrophosphohydrolase [Clostridiales bacterium]|nr:bifunctional (p)ppGpp synthetase/guanosine-3',5'-bis(diphosphate) 3'-pyrophosphohydrolase [Clostridiales bacterium]